MKIKATENIYKKFVESLEYGKRYLEEIGVLNDFYIGLVEAQRILVVKVLEVYSDGFLGEALIGTDIAVYYPFAAFVPVNEKLAEMIKEKLNDLDNLENIN